MSCPLYSMQIQKILSSSKFLVRVQKHFRCLCLKKKNFMRRLRMEDIGYGIFYGILIVMFFYNLLLYFVTKGSQLPLIHPDDCLHALLFLHQHLVMRENFYGPKALT